MDPCIIFQSLKIFLLQNVIIVNNDSARIIARSQRTPSKSDRSRQLCQIKYLLNEEFHACVIHNRNNAGA